MDFLYYATNVLLWSIVEAGLGITASSVSTLRPLFRNCLNLHGNTSQDYTRTAYSPALPLEDLSHKAPDRRTGGYTGPGFDPIRRAEEGLQRGNERDEKNFQVRTMTTIVAENNGARSARGYTRFGAGQPNNLTSQEVLVRSAADIDNGNSGQHTPDLVIQRSRADWAGEGEWSGGIVRTVEVRTQRKPPKMNMI